MVGFDFEGSSVRLLMAARSPFFGASSTPRRSASLGNTTCFYCWMYLLMSLNPSVVNKYNMLDCAPLFDKNTTISYWLARTSLSLYRQNTVSRRNIEPFLLSFISIFSEAFTICLRILLALRFRNFLLSLKISYTNCIARA